MLKEQIERSVYILREAKAKFQNIGVFWSTGKDSTAMLSLIREAFFGEVPFPVIFIDTGFHFKELLDFRDQVAAEWNLDLKIAKVETEVNPFDNSVRECCMIRKMQAARQIVSKYGFDALIVSIRRDEHGLRSKERVMSPRDKDWRWYVFKDSTNGDSPFEPLQDAELWNLYASDFGPNCDHVRIHPLLHWTELEIWQYIKLRNLPVNPLYFSKDGWRYRSLGCWPCTKPIRSNAKTIDEIIEEIRVSKTSERTGRHTEKEKYLMETLRALGYF